MRCKKCNELFRDDAEKCPYCGEGNPLGVAIASDKVKFWIQALTGSPMIVDYYNVGRTRWLRVIRKLKVLLIAYGLFSAALLPWLDIILDIIYETYDNSLDVNEEILKIMGFVFGGLTVLHIGICIADFFLNRQTAMAVENMTWGRHNSACLKIPVIIWGVMAALLLTCTLLVNRNFSGMAVFAVGMLVIQIVIMNLGKKAKEKIEVYKKYTADTKA